MTFEEFKFKYEEHIEGKAANLRTSRASNYGESARSKSAKGKKKNTSQSAVEEDDDTKSRKSAKADQDVANEINKELEQLKFEIPSSCFVKMSKSTKIEKLEAKYLLLAHPHPSFEGEMIFA